MAPGIALFGFVMLMFSSAMTLAKDRESALLSRLLTAPVRASEFIAAYSVPYLPVAVFQGVVIFVIGGFGGLEFRRNAGLVVLVLFAMSICYIGLGMMLGSVLTVNQVSVAYTVILLLTIFGGTWMDLEDIGGVFESIGDALPFAHALDAARDVMVDGVGLSAIATDLYWVLGYTLVIVVLAVVLFRRRMVE